jgi:hypothetical protein
MEWEAREECYSVGFFDHHLCKNILVYLRLKFGDLEFCRCRYTETHTTSVAYYTCQMKYCKEHEYSSLVIDLSIDRFSNLN